MIYIQCKILIAKFIPCNKTERRYSPDYIRFLFLLFCLFDPKQLLTITKCAGLMLIYKYCLITGAIISKYLHFINKLTNKNNKYVV